MSTLAIPALFVLTLVDAGARLGYARPVGAFDASTHAADTSHGAAPFALDATLRVAEPGTWTFSIGMMGSYAPTVPKQCGSFDDCRGSIGADTELLGLLRLRGPRTLFFHPEAELGAGWTWSSRGLANDGVESSRTWNGPVLARLAFIPTFRLGSQTRLGIVLGGSIARSASFDLDAPGVHRSGLEGARLHGTLDVGVRFGFDFNRRSD